MIKLVALRSDLIFLETQLAVVLKEAKNDILAAFYAKGTCYYDDCLSSHPLQTIFKMKLNI